ncbi:MAG: FdtA/QdtA family cupin domain-containing protein [Candidatus Pacebacteria bacterium]|jgi:dTDP-4-dehydrorhamnose 3,5-epimerase-like enzyme|nr:FdtA/QdtA family cupin domain-containing protein [Candidatus Paceibacterota bacterium]
MAININKTKKKLKTKNSFLIPISSVDEGSRGTLFFCEAMKQIPFLIKRVFWIYKVSPKRLRGAHARKKTELVLFCIQGSIKIELDDGYNKDNVILNKPNIGIFLGRLLWHKMYDFKKNTILLALASSLYNEADMIRDYTNFKKLINK